MPPSPPSSLLGRLKARPNWRIELAGAAGAIAAAIVVAVLVATPRQDRDVRDHPVAVAGHRLVAVSFDDLPGFFSDDLGAPLTTFRRSCAGDADTGRLAPACLRALSLADPIDDGAARDFFTGFFRPYRIEPADGANVVTAYYEPVVPGSRVRTAAFAAPLYPLPPDLVRITADNRPDGWDEELTAARRSEAGLVPYPTRAEINAGALDADVEPLVYVEDAAEAFFIHIQGSTRIELPDGATIRVGFAGKNGQPYSSVARAMQEAGIVPPGGFSMQSMRAFFRSDPEGARELMAKNRSYIFFREINGLDPALGPIGGEGVPLTEGRSLAIDTRYHAYGTPIFVDAVLPSGPRAAPETFRRLMIAQDTGSAIRGPGRLDLFWGTGPDAGAVAGGINADAAVYVFLPR